MFKKKLWRGLVGLFAALAMFMVFATLILFQYASVINTTFNIQTSIKVPGSSEGDKEYYKSDFGEISPENLKKVEAAAEAQATKEEEEGAVLLKNGTVNGKPALPLNPQTEGKVSLFGRAAYSPLYRTTAACTRVDVNNPDRVVSLNKALTDAGFSVNQTLFNAYASGKGREKPGISFLFEEPIAFYNAQQSSLANYKDVAIVMLTRSGGEGNDMAVDQSGDVRFTDAEVANSLALQTNEKNMLEFVKAQGFGKVIVLINTNYMMELDWFDEYGVDAAMYIGTPGLTGFTGVVNLLTGKDGLAPSGKLVDTFAANSLSSPAIVNAAGNTPQWANFGTNSYPTEVKDVSQQTSWVSVQQENIYVGYKYYETRYADAVMGDEGAKSAVGSSFDGGWDYAKEMCYPFGYGLSYTTFKKTITGVTDNEDGTYTVKVKVENTGSVAAKESVQVYVSTPYGDYEKARKIEKSAILFVGFGKTDVVQPGAANAAEIEVKVEEYLFASYDYTDAKGYVLTAGDYYFAVGSDAHDALNNVLGAKGYTDGLIDQNGNAVTPVQAATHKLTKALDATTYKYGENEVQVTNKFDKMNINYWAGNDVKYLSRSDWSGTFPTEAAKAYLQSGEMATLLQGEFYVKSSDAPSTDAYAQGKSNNWKGVDKGISFFAMREFEYNDGKWNDFIDQFDLEDLSTMTANYFGNKAITTGSINLDAKYGGDGCQGVGDTAYSKTVTGGDENLWPCLYTSVLPCTFNAELIENRGCLMANQALYLDATVIWTGGGNLHRTPYGGRNAEYYSEDANLCYIVGYIELTAMEKRGILGGIKHFTANDQEEHREGLNTFYTEQALREGSLRAFEGALRKGKVKAVMQAFNRQGVVFSSSCKELNIGVLREEWGYKGEVITDASSGVTTGYKAHYVTSMANGTDIYCLDGEGVAGGIIIDYIRKNDDGEMLGYLRESAKNVAYALSRSAAINGYDDGTKVVTVTPAWQVSVIVVACLFGAVAIGCVVMYILSAIKERTNNSVADNADNTDKEGE